MGQRILLGQILCEQGYITEEQLKQVCEEQIERHEPLGRTLVSLGHITEEELDEALEIQKQEMIKLSELI